MSNTDAVLQFITEDQLLEVLTLAQTGSKLNAAKSLQAYLFDKWRVSVTEAFGILINLQKEW